MRRDGAMGAGQLKSARAGVCAVFLLNGAGYASWVVRIPAVRERLALGEGALGLALLFSAVGALVAMPLAGGAVHRWGSRRATRLGALAFLASVPLPALAPSLALLALALFALGATGGVLGVAMNAQAATLEREAARPLLSTFHAFFSLGGLAGAGAGGVLAGHGVPAPVHLGAVALVLALLSEGAARHLRSGDAAATGAPAFARPGRALLALGTLAFCVLLGEGAMADWSAVYLRDVLGSGPGVAATGYAAFSLAMALGRLGGDALGARLGPVRLVRVSGALAAAGLALALLLRAPGAAVAGFACVGAGLSCVYPAALSAAGRLHPQRAATAIAAVSTVGYTGFLVGPALIGALAEGLGLRLALGTVVLAGAVIAGLSRAVGSGATAWSPLPSP